MCVALSQLLHLWDRKDREEQGVRGFKVIWKEGEKPQTGTFIGHGKQTTQGIDH